jgi:uncharacterized protein (DUF2225 family)
LISINNQVSCYEGSATRSKDARKYVDWKFPTRAIAIRDEKYIWHKNSFCEENRRNEDGAMTTLRQIELSCPICGNNFQSQAVVTTNAFGGKRTDFHERAAGMQPLAYLIHMCDGCGYSGGERDFTREAEISPLLKEHVLNELTPTLALEATGSEKYEAAAKVAEWQGLEDRQIADLLLRAAWCCVDEGDIEAERYFRRHAAWAFERALMKYDGVPDEERAILTYLVGELWRRTGDLGQSEKWFDRVEDEIVDPESQHWVITAADQQRVDPQEWFG